jgi:hypothetical protein
MAWPNSSRNVRRSPLSFWPRTCCNTIRSACPKPEVGKRRSVNQAGTGPGSCGEATVVAEMEESLYDERWMRLKSIKSAALVCRRYDKLGFFRFYYSKLFVHYCIYLFGQGVSVGRHYRSLIRDAVGRLLRLAKMRKLRRRTAAAGFGGAVRVASVALPHSRGRKNMSTSLGRYPRPSVNTPNRMNCPDDQFRLARELSHVPRKPGRLGSSRTSTILRTVCEKWTTGLCRASVRTGKEPKVDHSMLQGEVFFLLYSQRKTW